MVITIPVASLLWALGALAVVAYVVYSALGIYGDMQITPYEMRLYRHWGRKYTFARHLQGYRRGWRWLFLPSIALSYGLARWLTRNWGEGE